jgi:hypothetical protein
MKAIRGAFLGALVLIAGCAPLTLEEQLRREVMVDVYWASARECVRQYSNLQLDRMQLNGDLSVSAAAESRFDRLPFTACYHEAIVKRIAQRRAAGKTVPEDIGIEPEVDLD